MTAATGRTDPSGRSAASFASDNAARDEAALTCRTNDATAAAVGRSSTADNGFERLVVSKDAPPLHVEQFRGLAATLLSAQREQPLRSVIVTSACPGDGKSHVAVNLALTLSESYHLRVLLIDADLRRPSLHRLFGIRNSRRAQRCARGEVGREARGGGGERRG